MMLTFICILFILDGVWCIGLAAYAYGTNRLNGSYTALFTVFSLAMIYFGVYGLMVF